MPSPSTSGGTPRTAKFSFRMPTTAGTINAAVIKSKPGGVFFWMGRTFCAADRWFKFYNQTTLPNPATDIPLATIFLPGQEEFPPMQFLDFTAGIAMAITTGAEDSNADPIDASDIIGLNIFYD